MNALQHGLEGAANRATGFSSLAAFGIQVLALEASTSGTLIADMITFLNPLLFPSFGFPQELPEGSVEMDSPPDHATSAAD